MVKSIFRRDAGFTLVELVTIMVLLGILAVVALPKINSATSFRAVEFRDQVMAALRFSQKTATSHRRIVCAALASNSVTLTVDHDRSGACDAHALPIPGASANVVLSTDSAAVFSAVPASVLYFQPDGRITSDLAGSSNQTVSMTIDGLSVYVAGSTGYIGDAP